jgi:hypothetical protein
MFDNVSHRCTLAAVVQSEGVDVAAARQIRRRRAFDRSAFIGFRCPDEDRRRVDMLASRARRDVSSLMIEWMADGATRLEAALNRKQKDAQALGT